MIVSDENNLDYDKSLLFSANLHPIHFIFFNFFQEFTIS